MPGWSESGQRWLSRPMATGEAVTFLREYITMRGFGSTAHLYTCHSAKATIFLGCKIKHDGLPTVGTPLGPWRGLCPHICSG